MLPAVQWSQKILFLSVLSLGTVIPQSTLAEGQPSPGSFYCGTDGGIPATLVAHPVRKEIVFIRWTSSYFSNAGWTPEKRCEEVSPRFQSNKEAKTLDYIISGTLNGLPVLCGSSSSGGGCSEKTLLFTLKKASDADPAIKEIATLNQSITAPALNQNPEAVEVGRNGSLVINVGKMMMALPHPQHQPRIQPSSQSNILGSCETQFIGTCE